MNIFLNDYNDLCHEKVYKKLATVKEKGNPGYGSDEYTERAKELIKRDLKRDDVQIEFLAGGTIANIIGISANLMAYEGIIAVESGHIVGHEAGSIEATGHKVELIYSEDGKLSGELLEKRMEDFGEEYHIVPKLVYISQTTELGTVYSYDELREIYDVCLKYGLYLYIDGARMAVGLAASDVKVEDLCDLCDIFTLGGTKNGALYGEALVIVEDELKENLRHFMKQRGAVMAKGFILGAQFEALFEDGLYYELGKRAYENSLKLSRAVEETGVSFYKKPESNQIFIVYPKSKIDELFKDNAFEVMPYDEENRVLRFVTNYRTTEEEIEGLKASLINLK
ncbi:threonine aldolase family protein [Anaerosphaera multitolerans]|uniref:Aminotransferase class V-fold PLP-dependent enzyme n=1 Tax=Anaerosphaera multitolerans TaxID=2487351 RepID=A0A437S962_9FIRM|nr:aminotransferase class V-fold PLP-dependent enzyme [Anaerosphaera multitolerans]RVU55655.1 aminotransferase class V-fold PLP-dependent enzyme [Anaerosphaera multitolerans]